MPSCLRPRISGALLLAALLCAAPRAGAEPTQLFSVDGASDLRDGRAERATVTSDGRVMLPPELKSLHLSEAYGQSLSFAPGAGGEIYAGVTDTGIVVSLSAAHGATLPPLLPPKKGDKKDAKKDAAPEEAPEVEPLPGEICRVEESLVTALAVHRGELLIGSSPGGKLYAADPSAKAPTPEVVFEPQSLYIWSILPTPGAVYVGTGEPAQLWKLTRKKGQKSFEGEMLYELPEKHLRVLRDGGKAGGLLLGGGEEGRIYHWKDGRMRVLADLEPKEITDIYALKDGSVVASAVTGTNLPEAADPEPSARKPGWNVDAFDSVVVHIAPDRHARVLWHTKNEPVLSLGADARGRVLVGTGFRGHLYAVELAPRHPEPALLLEAGGEAIERLLPGKKGAWIALQSGPLQSARIGPGVAAEGVYASKVLDAGLVARFGRLEWRAELPAKTTLKLQTRSGFSAEPDASWEAWAPVKPETRSLGMHGSLAGTVSSPPGRYLQWRAVLGGAGKQSPALFRVDVSYRRFNQRPQLSTPQFLLPGNSVEPVAERGEYDRTVPLNDDTLLELSGRGAPQNPEPPQIKVRLKPGAMAVAWSASDPNGDALRYDVEIRRDSDPLWTPLAKDSPHAWVTLQLGDLGEGAYRVRVTARDEFANPPGEGLADVAESETLFVDLRAPSFEGVKTQSRKDGAVEIQATVRDSFSPLAALSYTVDGGEARPLLSGDGLVDAREETLRVTISDLEAGQHMVTLSAEDRAGNRAVHRLSVRAR